jgi:4-hydroxythreonine-4-phosphate dehydrogenase
MPMKKKATIAAMIGDPSGIGPEVVVKTLATQALDARVLLVGDTGVVADTIALLGAPLTARRIDDVSQARFEPGVVDVLDDGLLDRAACPLGQLSPESGRAVTAWWDIATRLALDEQVDAIIKAPVNFEAIRLSGARPAVSTGVDQTHLLLVTGPLRVVHLTDHVPLREVFAHLRRDAIAELIRLTDASLRRWGVAAPRIGVAGINPHASGDEERLEIAPAIEMACSEGIDARGPVSPDSLFRQCIDGQYDCVLAHYHDQGHIAVKTWRFEGNCALVLGEPFLRISVAHGTAFDIAGRGIADHRSMAAAMRHAATLGGAQGFPAD